jgi:hypothetical protein
VLPQLIPVLELLVMVEQDLLVESNFQLQQNDHSMPSNEILDMLGAGAKMWMDKKRKEEEQNPEI